MNICQSKIALGCAERVALCALRRALRGESDQCGASVCPFGLGRDDRDVRRHFARVWEDQGVPFQFSNLGSWGVTRTERHLLRALEAAQVEHGEALAQSLANFMLAASVRHRLAVALEALAATLAVHGYWLRQPDDLLPLPAPALLMARAQGRDLAMTKIAWPGLAP